MALSNWDTFSMTLDGEECNGAFVSKVGVKVSIYKNWIYIYDEKGWTKCNYTKPCVAEIQEGIVFYKDVKIVAVRNESQQSIFCFVSSGYDKEEKGMIGIGCYGYCGDGFAGVTEKTLSEFKKWIDNHDEYPYIPEKTKKLDLKKGKRFNQGDFYFIGEESKSKVGDNKDKSLLHEMIEGMKKE